MNAPDEPQPHLHPTRPSTLALIALVAGAGGWGAMQVFYSELPPLPWLGAALVGLLAIVEGLLARSLGRRIARRPGSTPVEPLVAARAAVLAKASSLLGGVWGGGFAGVGLWLAPRASQVAAAKADLPSAALSFVAGAGLVAAALYLEHACRIPEEPTQN